MNALGFITRNKQRSVLLALGLGEILALGLWALSLLKPMEISARPAGALRRNTMDATQPINLQFLDSKSFDYFWPGFVQNPFSGPAVYIATQNSPPPKNVTQPPRPLQPPQPKPKIKIEVVYRGTMRVDDGSHLALVEDLRKKSQRFYKVGDEMHVFKVTSFDEEQLLMEDAGGATMLLPKGLPTIIGELDP